MPAESMKTVLRDLSALLDRELQEIRLRNFERIAGLLRRKENLINAFDTLVERSTLGADEGALIKEFEAMRAKAANNAAQLLAMRQGFSDARARLEALHRQDASTGLYAPDGEEIRERGSAAADRSV